MSYGFVFILPFTIGYITVYFSQKSTRDVIAFRIFAPWLTVTLSLLLTMIAGLEGTICLIMALPIYLLMGSLGGITAGIVANIKDRKRNHLILAGLLFLPFGSGYMEQGIEMPSENRHVYTSIVIEADQDTVWSNITAIPLITEEQNGFFYFMGFPKAKEATLSYPGVGGVREAKFEKGLEFTETITEWIPNKKIVFTIKSNPEFTPLTTLDPHVVVGGDFFDTLEGGYELEELDQGRIHLHLYSEYRLSTRFNFYASLWGDFLMRDIQNNILRVIKLRCENQFKQK
ncbi:MAG: hypothetical protein JJT78_04830 [Leptospira sp.]|nr:hypothetical protein [Leptospira sp.]